MSNRKNGAKRQDARRVSSQNVVNHPPGYQLTESDRAAIAAGTQQHFTRAALDEIEMAARYYGFDEISFACVTDPDDLVIKQIKVFEDQEVSPGHVTVSGRSRIRARREARKEGVVIRFEGHTHGVDGALFSSGLDEDRAQKIADGGVGIRATQKTVAKGRLKRVDRVQQGVQEGGVDECTQ